MKVEPITTRGGVRRGEARRDPPGGLVDETLNEVLTRERTKREAAKAKLEELALAKAMGEVIPAAEFERKMSAIVKIFVGAMDTMPDILERDCGLERATLERVRATLGDVRKALHDELVRES